jgi:hypothetical protein
MKTRISLAMATIFIITCLPSVCLGAFYNVSFCFEYEVLYDDRTGGDWWNSTADKTARGIRAKIIRNHDDAEIYYDYTGSNTGCTDTMLLSSNNTYWIKLYSQAKLANNNKVYVYNNDTDNERYFTSVATAFSPDRSGVFTFDFPHYSFSTTRVSNTAAAAGYAINKRYGGLSGQTFTLYTQSCPESGGSCRWPGTSSNYMSEFGRTRKYIIAHEMGHTLGYLRNESSDSVLDYSCGTTFCGEYPGNDFHDLTSKEYQTSGASEGFAHYYAAEVWNDASEYNCSFYYYKSLDFSHDSPDTDPDEDQDYDCENGDDYLGSHCWILVNRSVELDWLRFWWDLRTDEEESFGNIADIWDGANPHTWNRYTAYGRLRGSAETEGVDLDEWDDWAEYNGVHR